MTMMTMNSHLDTSKTTSPQHIPPPQVVTPTATRQKWRKWWWQHQYQKGLETRRISSSRGLFFFEDCFFVLETWSLGTFFFLFSFIWYSTIYSTNDYLQIDYMMKTNNVKGSSRLWIAKQLQDSSDDGSKQIKRWAMRDGDSRRVCVLGSHMVCPFL
jgi:hypothetical protein